MCNALNHRPGCRCGWGGDGHLGRSPGGYGHVPIRTPKPRALPVRRGFDSYTDPNARCPVCGDSVFFYQAPSGGRVFFDELGPPWPKHPCTDNPRIPVALNLPPATPAGAAAPDRRLAGWQVEGWLPIQIESSVRDGSAHAMRCATWDGGYREFRVFLDAVVVVTGVAAAAIKPWDEGGRSVISYVELDTEAQPQVIDVLRAAPGQARFIVDQLLKVIAAAESEAPTAEALRIAQRFSELEQRMQTWAQHLSTEEAEQYWDRFRLAHARATDRMAAAQHAEVAEKERIVTELETIVGSTDWSDADNRFTALVTQWHSQRRTSARRDAESELANRFRVAEGRGLARRDDARRQRLAVARVAEKQAVIADLEALVAMDDWAIADREYSLLQKRWAQTGHFKRADEAQLTERFMRADSEYRAARSQERERVARVRESRERAARIELKAKLVAELEDLADGVIDGDSANRAYQQVRSKWPAAAHMFGADEVELSTAFAAAESRFAVVQERRMAAERHAEQERVVAEADVLAEAPYWDAQGFEKLSQRWTAAGPSFDPGLRRRFQNAYLLARGPGFKQAIRSRLEILANAERLSVAADWPERARAFSEITGQWRSAAWAGPDIERPLEVRYRSALTDFLSSCNAVDLAAFTKAVETDVLDARSPANGEKAAEHERLVGHLRQLAAAMAQG